MRLILVRHGQTTSNVDRLLDTGFPGAPLTEHGHGQAASLVDRLSHEHLDAIHSSDLIRAKQTALPLAQARGLAVEEHPGLREIQAGEWEMSPEWQPYVQVVLSWFNGELDNRMLCGDSGREFLDRFDATIDTLADRGYDSMAVVSHGAAIRVWTASRALNLPFDVVSQPIDYTTAITLVGDPKSKWTVESWGDLRL